MSAKDIEFHNWRLALAKLYYDSLPRQVFHVSRYAFEKGVTPEEAHLIFDSWLRGGGKAKLVKTQSSGLARDQYNMVPEPDPFDDATIEAARAALERSGAPKATTAVKVDEAYVQYLFDTLRDVAELANAALSKRP